jgi:hypothetical protein
MIHRAMALALLLLVTGCVAADRSGSPAVSGAYVSGAGGGHP